MKPELPHRTFPGNSPVEMRPSDCFSEGGIDWTPVKSNTEGWTFVDRKKAGDERFISHSEVRQMLADGSARIRCGRDARGSDPGRAIFEDLTFTEITGKKRDLALFREKMIHLYDADRVSLGRKPRWSREIFERDLRRYRKRIITEMLRPTPVQRRLEELTRLMARR
ncbi:hypothetical protein [Rhizobium sp. CC-YZS058]|uniref:hypothetical protein n=1 Tax=Rhizobium sp. CC-YZS058 TaxID=3042153 RepID=UPI002B0623C1|nr:hypothetical protein [Rhizobium sp. CC-YZS058]MEA3536979.1 hypothetical protein [Rhizobium sp. CC-YZS058]